MRMGFHGVVALMLTLCTFAQGLSAQTPTVSLEAAGVNYRPLEHPVRSISVFPGDVITVEVYIRDWSPKGEHLGAYQAQMDPAGFTTGPTGYIEPVDYAETMKLGADNRANCFVDRSHPRYVHKGPTAMALTDTRSEGYRWVSVVIGGETPVAKQDGTKYYGGTVYMEVSHNASGTFTLGLMPEDESTGLREPIGSAILPMEVESMTVEIRDPQERGFLVALIDGINRRSARPPVSEPLLPRTPEGELAELKFEDNAATAALRLIDKLNSVDQSKVDARRE